MPDSSPTTAPNPTITIAFTERPAMGRYRSMASGERYRVGRVGGTMIPDTPGQRPPRARVAEQHARAIRHRDGAGAHWIDGRDMRDAADLHDDAGVRRCVDAKA